MKTDKQQVQELVMLINSYGDICFANGHNCNVDSPVRHELHEAIRRRLADLFKISIDELQAIEKSPLLKSCEVVEKRVEFVVQLSFNGCWWNDLVALNGDLHCAKMNLDEIRGMFKGGVAARLCKVTRETLDFKQADGKSEGGAAE